MANLKHFANNCNVRKLQNKKNNVAKIKDIAAKVAITLQNVAKHFEMEWIAESSKKANFMSCKKNWVAETSEKAYFMGCGNFQKKGKFQVNLNKGLCLLFRAEPQMKRRVCNKDAIKEGAPNSFKFSSIQLLLQFNSIQLTLNIKIISFK